MDPRLRQAIDAVDRGDVATLQELLRAEPDLVRHCVETTEPPYDAYFGRAALLHHVAGNPQRPADGGLHTLPGNIVDVTRLLLEHGAEVDATCGASDGSGGTTLGLVASSSVAASQGHAAALINVLVGAGADVDFGGGACLHTALYHCVECRDQRDVATLLLDHGASVDFVFAAGLGRLDLMQPFLDKAGRTRSDADRLSRGFDRDGEPGDDKEVFTQALIYAAANGRNEVVTWLLDRGVAIDALGRFGPERPAALHAAAWAGWSDTARLLVERGADVNLRDPQHESTAAGWAEYCRQPETLAYLLTQSGAFDLMNAVEFGATERVAELLGAGDPDQSVGEGQPGVMLRFASWRGHDGLVSWLLERGADPALPNPDGKTALDAALAAGHEHIAALIRARNGHAGGEPA